MLLLFFLQGFAISQQHSRRTPVVEVVEKVGTAIVNISTEQLIRNPQPTDLEDFFNDFFESYRPPVVLKTHSLGSGVLVDKEGFIITNYHVIQRASKITVVLANKNKYDAQVLANDEKNDLALLKINSPERLPYIKMGISSDIMIGESVITLGNPFGLQNTVTTGVISATDRSIGVKGEVHFHDFLQTDAPINPGNSGGALLNINGELIGINVAIFSKGQGLGFAIPVNRIRHMLGVLLDPVKLKKQWVGIDLEERESNSTSWTVRVLKVFENSPAERAGVSQGDIIKKVDGVDLECLFDFHKKIYLKEVGDMVSLELLSSHRIKTVNLKIANSQPTKVQEDVFWDQIGILPLQIQGGVLVRKVKTSSSAERIGIQAGDIIVSLEGYPIRTLEELLYVLNTKEKREAFNIVVLRNGRKLGGNLIKE